MAVKRARSRAVITKQQKEVDSATVRELATLLRREFPEIDLREKLANLSFSFGKKVVGFTRGEEAVAMKLPAARVVELQEKRGWKSLVMGKRVMKEWIVVERDAGWEMALFREAVEFVSGGR